METVKEWVKVHRKAIVAGVTAAVVAFVGVYPDGVTANEWSAVLAAFLLPFGFTWAVPNKPAVNPPPGD